GVLANVGFLNARSVNTQQTNEIRAQRFQVVNKQGKIVAELGEFEWLREDLAKLTFYDQRGRTEWSAYDAYAVSFRDRSTGKPRIVIGVPQDPDKPLIELRDREGKTTWQTE